jgi:hypothetical protein
MLRHGVEALWTRRTISADDLSTESLMRWARYLLSAEDQRKRAEDLQKLRRKKREQQPKNRPPK